MKKYLKFSCGGRGRNGILFITGKFFPHTSIIKIISYDRHIQEINFFQENT